MRSCRPLQLLVELSSAVTQDQRSLSYLAVVTSQQMKIGSKQVSRLWEALGCLHLLAQVTQVHIVSVQAEQMQMSSCRMVSTLKVTSAVSALLQVFQAHSVQILQALPDLNLARGSLQLRCSSPEGLGLLILAVHPQGESGTEAHAGTT